MKYLKCGALRELAKFLWDITKLTSTAAFITPCFTIVNIDSSVTLWMATVAIMTFFAGLYLHYLTDHLELKEAEEKKQGIEEKAKENWQEPKSKGRKEGQEKTGHPRSRRKKRGRERGEE